MTGWCWKGYSSGSGSHTNLARVRQCDLQEGMITAEASGTQQRIVMMADRTVDAAVDAV